MEAIAPSQSASTSPTPPVDIRQLLSLTNEGKDPDTLRVHLTQAANLTGVFELFDHSIGILDTASAELIGKSIHTLRELARDTTVILENDGGTWKSSTKPNELLAILFLKDFIVKKRKTLLDEAVSPIKETKEHRSRSKKKSKKRRRSSSSSHSSSQRRRAKTDDARKIIDNSPFKFIGEDHFPGANLVKSIAKHKPSDGLYISSTPIEEWVPSYVGAQQTSKEQKKTILARQSQTSFSGTQIIEHTVAFWSTHGLNGSIQPNSVIKFMLLITRMCSDRTQGPSFAIKYFRHLITYIRKTISESTIKLTTLDDFIVKVLPEPLTQTNIEHGTSSIKGKGRDIGFKGGGQFLPPPPPPRGHQPSRPPKGGGKGSSTGKPSDKICVYHDPSSGKTCQHGDGCQFKHLDTSKPAELAAYKAAATSFSALMKKRKNKSIAPGTGAGV